MLENANIKNLKMQLIEINSKCVVITNQKDVERFCIMMIND